jgi:hypothetical protein
VKSADSVTIDSVLTEIQKGLAKAQTEIVDQGMPPLKSVQVTLQTVATQKVGGTLKLLIFSIGSTVTKERTQQLTLTLKPPALKKELVAGAPSIAEGLTQALVSAAAGVQAARTGTPPLVLDTLEVQLSFVVTREGGAGGSVTIAPVTLELKGDISKKAVHQLKVTLAPPDKPKE